MCMTLRPLFERSVMRNLFACACCFSLVLGVPWDSSAQKVGTLGKLMQEKLNSSKMLLEGIALADFNKINRSAESLIQLSKTAEWFVYKTPISPLCRFT